jgi:predicted Zn-dependent protease
MSQASTFFQVGSRRRLMMSGLVLGVLFLGACTGDQSVLLPPQPPVRPPASDFALQRISEREHQRMLALFGGEYRAPATKALLDQIIQRLTKASTNPGQTYDVILLNSPVPNAFALPGGQLYLTRGLLVLINDTAEAAAVLSHEMAHVIARHAGERDELQRRNKLFGQVNAQVLNAPADSPSSGAASSLSRFSRQQELEADSIGVRLLAAAGYDPYAASRMLTTLSRSASQAAAGGGDPGSSPAMQNSHPSNPDRIARILSGARQISAPGIGERNRDAWLTVIDGIAFGSDPREGVVRGRRYINSSLSISFTAPEGMTLDASVDYVLGSTANGRQVMRFEGVVLDGRQSLEAYAASGWLQGMETSDVRTTTIAGNEAALARGKGANWDFRLAAIRIENRVYRFIVAQSGEGDLDRAFQVLTDSFQKLPADEARKTGLMRVRTVTASAGSTSEELAQRMSLAERSLDQFFVINGLDRQSALQPGTRYKIVSE